MEFLGITDKQNYIGFTYKSPITYLYLFTVYLPLAENSGQTMDNLAHVLRTQEG